jgi:tetratricopeptide (TPR) repeat protein
LPVIGLVFGYAWFLNSAPDALQDRDSKRPDRKKAWAALAVVLLGILVAALFFRRPLAGAWYANLGAVRQTRLELTRYDPVKFDQYSLDQVRQDSSRAGDLEPALADFAKALANDPDYRTALQRQAQIALSLGDYPAALREMQRLWQAGYRDDVTRLLYGDALIAGGQVEAAVEAVRGLTWAEPRLLGQAWYRYWLNGDYRRAADAWSAVLLLNPQAQGIDYWLEQARSKVK